MPIFMKFWIKPDKMSNHIGDFLFILFFVKNGIHIFRVIYLRFCLISNLSNINRTIEKEEEELRILNFLDFDFLERKFEYLFGKDKKIRIVRQDSYDFRAWEEWERKSWRKDSWKDRKHWQIEFFTWILAKKPPRIWAKKIFEI